MNAAPPLILPTDDEQEYVVNFTGQHHNYGINDSINQVGFIVSSTGAYRNQYASRFKITINESLPIVDYSRVEKDPAVFGVISNANDDANAEPIINKSLIVNGLGEGGVWVCNANGSIQNGDYITSSPIPGIGMRQTETTMNNYTVAKSTTRCDFTNEQTPIKQKQYDIIKKMCTVEVDVSSNELVMEDVCDTVVVEEPMVDAVETIEYSYQLIYGTFGIQQYPTPFTVVTQVPRTTTVDTIDESGNTVQVEIPIMHTVVKLVPRTTTVYLTDEHGNQVLDEFGEPVSQHVNVQEPRLREVIRKMTVEQEYDALQSNLITYVDSTDTTNKYDSKYITINADNYVIYNDDARTDVFTIVAHVFEPALIGNTYAMAFIGCTYHCG